MFEAGVLFLAAQFLLGFVVWNFAGHGSSSAIRTLPGGASAIIIFAVVVVDVEILAFGMVGEKTWAAMYFTPAPVDSLLIQAQAEQFAYYFRYPGADGKLGLMHLDKTDDASENYLGLDRKADRDSRDDIISPVLVAPVNSMGIDFEFSTGCRDDSIVGCRSDPRRFIVVQRWPRKGRTPWLGILPWQMTRQWHLTCGRRVGQLPGDMSEHR